MQTMISRIFIGKARYQNIRTPFTCGTGLKLVGSMSTYAAVRSTTSNGMMNTVIYAAFPASARTALRSTATLKVHARFIQYLLIPNKEDEHTVTSLGAEWDDDKKKWYVPDSVSLKQFAAWVPPERERVLDVPFEDKDLVKYLGAKWDVTKKEWFLPSDVSSHHFQQWLPTRGGNDMDSNDTDEEYLHSAPKVYLDVNTCDNDDIKKLGAEWDENERKFFIPDHLDIKLFRKYLKFYLQAGRSDSDALKLLGAEYDSAVKRWCVPKYIPRIIFSPWLFSYYNEFLDVPFESREEAKALGALWEPDYRMWYYPEVYHLINKNTGENEAHKKARDDFRQWFRFPLHIPYEDKDVAKDLGARWDVLKKVWYAPMQFLGPDSKLRDNLLYREQIAEIIEHHGQ